MWQSLDCNVLCGVHKSWLWAKLHLVIVHLRSCLKQCFPVGLYFVPFCFRNSLTYVALSGMELTM